jgi:hypothetical protein
MTTKSWLKSKTLMINALIPALWGIAEALGVDVPPEVIAGTLAIVNFILRFVTKEPIGK